MTGESLRQTDTNFESEENTMKKILALLLAVAMIAAFCACAQQSADTAPAATTDTAAETTTDTAAETPAAETTADTAAETPAASDGALIKVGIINNDPNESGYRTANDKDLKAMFTEENEVRPVLKRLSLMAERTQCAVILIGHMNKAQGLKSGYRGLGSIDFRASARSVLIVGRLKSGDTLRIVAQDKNSLAPEGAAIAFELHPEHGFQWKGFCDATVDNILNGTGQV